jgi:hypothetical protein
LPTQVTQPGIDTVFAATFGALTIGLLARTARVLWIFGFACIAVASVYGNEQGQPPGIAVPTDHSRGAAPPAQAGPPDDPLDGWTFSGTPEGFYQWNFNQRPDRINLLRAYDTRANTFALQQVALLLERAPKPDPTAAFDKTCRRRR